MTDQNQAIRDDIAFMRALWPRKRRQSLMLGSSVLVAVAG